MFAIVSASVIPRMCRRM